MRPIHRPIYRRVARPIHERTISAASAFTPSSLTNLVLWYENSVLARTSWNTAGSQLNNSGTGPDGKLFSGSAYEFVAANEDYINTGVAFNATTAYEGLFLIKSPPDVTNAYQMFDGRDGGGDGVGLQFAGSLAGDPIRFFHNSTTLTSAAYTADTLYSLYFKWDGTTVTLKIYDKNGVLLEEVDATDNTQISVTSSFEIGRTFATSLYYSGQIARAVVRTNNTTFDLEDLIINPQGSTEGMDGVLFDYLLQEKFQQKEGAVISQKGTHGTFKSIAAGAYNPVINGIEAGFQSSLSGWNRYTISAGTGTLSSTGTAVTGSGTSFTTELAVNDVILADNEFRRITAIADNTNLTIASAFTVNLSADSFVRYLYNDTSGDVASVYGSTYDATEDIWGNTIQTEFKNQILNFSDIENDTGINKLECGDLGNNRTLSILMRFNDVSDHTFAETNATGTIALTSNAIVAAEFDDITVDGGANSIVVNTWHVVQLTANSDVDLNAFAFTDACIEQVSILAYSGTKKNNAELENIRDYFDSLL